MSNYKIFNKLAEQTLARPRMKKKELLQNFLLIEEKIHYGIDLLLQVSTFVEDNLCYVLAEIALGTIKSRKIYRGKRNKKRLSVSDSVDVAAENFRVLSLGFDLFKISRLDRPTALSFSRRIIRSLKLSTHIYEGILRTFAKETANYCDLVDEATALTLKISSLEDSGPERTILSAQLEEVLEKISAIEQTIGCSDSAKLYGINRLLLALIKQITTLQSRILSSYQRMVLHPSREKSISESEALDLFQSGSLGLSRAISLYDTDNNSSFPSFAAFWIKQRIMGSAKLSGPLIKLPWSIWEGYGLIRSAERQLEKDPEKRYRFTDADVAKLLKKSVASVQKIKEAIQVTKIGSLDTPQHTPDDSGETAQPLSSTIPDEQIIEREEMQKNKELVKETLSQLPADEKRILCLRFGLIDELEIDGSANYAIAKELFRQCAYQAQKYLLITGSAS